MTLGFALVASDTRLQGAVDAFCAAVHARTGIGLTPRAVQSYTALFEAMHQHQAEIAWCPPLVALDLAVAGSARPLVAPMRANGTSYHTVIVSSATGSMRTLGDLAGGHMGWVAPESSAGHVVPRLHLQSLGLDPDTLFARQTFLGSHSLAAAALVAGRVDAIATHATLERATRRYLPSALEAPHRVLASAGPIPGDVIVVGSKLALDTQRRLARALLDMPASDLARLDELMNLRGFGLVSSTHLDSLRRMRERAAARALQPAAPQGSASTHRSPPR